MTQDKPVEDQEEKQRVQLFCKNVDKLLTKPNVMKIIQFQYFLIIY